MAMPNQIKKIALSDRQYPKRLKSIANRPKALYVVGEIPSDEKCFAVVGTRRYSDYGKEAALRITSDLAECGLVIVSGLAPGIDTFAHKAALEAGGKTIAVLGTGPDQKSIYPKENLGLAKKIVEAGGALISEYPPGTRGSKITFPQRNRIISGLSLGVLVIEAKHRSGALITAGYAKSQKRKIFAVPGPITSLGSAGPHALIKNGAILAENAEDILQELKLSGAKHGQKVLQWENDEQKLILGALAREGSLHAEEIIEKTKLPATAVAQNLALMELEGSIKNLGGGVYCRLG